MVWERMAHLREEMTGVERWQALGRWIGDHLAFIAPVCVAIGVLFPQVFGPVNTYAVPFLFAGMTFQGALSNTFAQLVHVFRHPAYMVAIILSAQLVLPILAYGLAQLVFAGSHEVILGILLEYCVPVGVITFMWVGMYAGNGALALGTILVSTLIAPFTIPLTLQVFMGAVVHVDALGMMISMIQMIGIPAVIGMLVNQVSHGWGERVLSPAIAPLIKLFVIVIIISNSTGMSDYVLHPTPELVAVAVFVLAFSTFAYAWGYGLARLAHRGYEDQVAIGYCCGIRNISAGAVIASVYFPGTPVIFPCMVGTLLQQMLAATFGSFIRRVNGKREA